MEDTTKRTLTKGETVRLYLGTARAVYDFLISLPDTVARAVFHAAVQDAYDIAVLQDRKKVLRSMAGSIIENFNPDFNISDNNMNRILGWDETETEYWRSFDNLDPDDIEAQTSHIAGLLMSRYPDSLPDMMDLVRSYPMFRIDKNDIYQTNSFFSSFESSMGELLDRQDGEFSSLMSDYPMDDNVFYVLGYQTLFYFWSMNPEDRNGRSSLMFRWFCLGEVLDYVLEAFMRSRSRVMSDRMWGQFVDACARSKEFRDIFQDRYDKVLGSVASHKFECSSESGPVIAALDPIPLENGGRTNISAGHYEKLYDNIHFFNGKGFINCTLPEFKRLFRGGSATVDPVKWCGKGKDLADFLVCCLGIKTRPSRQFIKRAAAIFVDKKGRPFSENTLRSPHDYCNNTMTIIFRNSGIYR